MADFNFRPNYNISKNKNLSKKNYIQPNGFDTPKISFLYSNTTYFQKIEEKLEYYSLDQFGFPWLYNTCFDPEFITELFSPNENNDTSDDYSSSESSEENITIVGRLMNFY